MNISEVIKYQTEVMQIINNSFSNNLLSHAYLFVGDAGCGIEEVIEYFSMKLLCDNENKPCYDCISCSNVQSKNHLNVYIIEPLNDLIKKEQIESLIREFSSSSIIGGNQIYIIKDADKMNISASNALLKFLEEPLANRYGILTTSNQKKVIDTIVSRTQVIYFKKIAEEQIVCHLIKEGIEPDLSYILANITSNTIIAKQMISEGKIIEFLNAVKKIFISIIKNRSPYVSLFQKRDLILNEKDKKWHRIFLDIMILVYKEMLVLKDEGNCRYFHDTLSGLESSNINKDDILNHIDIILKYQERLNYNVNIELLYASMFCEI